MEDFVHLHVHTYYSILDGMSPIPKLVSKAVNNGMRGMAITDHGNMFGVKELFDCCAKLNKDRKKEGLEPFKPICGCEMYVAHRNKEDMDHMQGDRGGYHLIVLAKNETGYHNLVKLVSRSWVDGFYSKPRTDRRDLQQFHEGLIVCSACIAGEVPSKILEQDIEGAREAIEWYHGIWGDDYYLELQRHEVKDPTQRANRETFPLQQNANKVLLELAKEYGIKVVCTNDCHFVDEDDAEAHDHLLCLSTGKDLDDPTRMLYSKQEWFKTREEMNAIFSDLPEALANTCEILDKVELYSIESNPIMPNFPIPEEFGTEEQWRAKFSEEDIRREFTTDENGENPLPAEEAEAKVKKMGGVDKLYRIKFEADYLGKLAYDGAKRIYGDPVPKEVEEHIRFELHVMKTMGFPGYFLIVQDFINSARNELGVWVGPGRGSAAGSVVAYCLGITRLDPLKYNLLFERFLNPDRISLPDIDTDFDDDGRGKVLQWVMDKYGAENCAHIITYATMATKNSLRDVARVEKLPLDISNALCKAIPDRLNYKGKELKMNLENAIKCTPELQKAEASSDPRESNTIKYARKLEGTVRGTGIHACGFIICRDPISDHVPISTADDPDFPGVKTTVTQYDGHVIESTGLIKMDFLGLKTLSEQKEAVKIIKRTHGVDIDLDNIPLDDELTYKLYQEGRTIGTFQFESPGMQKYLRELHPTVFEDLIAMNALYRPGPMDKIPSFIRRKHGVEKIEYDIPVMEQYLKETYGITVYQEQVMLLSRLLADFTRGQSDSLRKAMGKKQKAIVDQMKPMFIEGGKKKGHDPKVLEKIWGDWESFASYAFNKSHAACYSWVAYQTAYLKAHYPAEFMAAIMTRRRNDIKEITKLMDECRLMGITTMGPDVNESFSEFGVNKHGEIRFGLAAVKNMGEVAAEDIISEREKNGPYKDIYDFAERINYASVNRRCLEALVYSGALDSFGLKRQQYFLANNKGDIFLDALIKYGNTCQNDKMQAQASLFGDMEEFSITKPDAPVYMGNALDLDILNTERSYIGIYLSAHPLDKYKLFMRKFCTAHPAELSSDNRSMLYNKGSEWTCGGIVTSVDERISQKGNAYGRVKIEDFTNEGEIMIFNNWHGVRNSFIKDAVIFMKIKMEEHPYIPNRIDMKFVSIGSMEDMQREMMKRLTITVPIEIFDESFNKILAKYIKGNKGYTTLRIRAIDTSTNTPLTLVNKNDITVSYDMVEALEQFEGVRVEFE
ncbi:MAG: DNA polymerase III subunit alpha [Bacteroidaceae bacterium]|nr:DNA polymerase III subunit alpha [Bacteroidaceae bacterium]